MDFDIRAGGDVSRYLRSEVGTVLVKPTSVKRTVAGYLVLSPEQARSLVRELHHWLENEREKND
jgi:hypothetical protein